MSYTSQTYVDSLKESGTFTDAAQKEALRRSLRTAMNFLSPAALAFIRRTYVDMFDGDSEDYLTFLIEAEVKRQKNDLTATIGGELEGLSEAEFAERTRKVISESTAQIADDIAEKLRGVFSGATPPNPAATQGEEKEIPDGCWF